MSHSGDRGVIPVSVPQADISLSALMAQLGPLPPLTAVLGVTGDSRPLLLRLPSPEVGHVLVTGGSFDGRASLLSTIGRSLRARNTPENLDVFIASRPIVVDIFDRLVASLDQRRVDNYRPGPWTAVLINIDGDAPREQLGYLLAYGRKYGISLVIATNPGQPVLTRADFGVRIVGRVIDANQARQVTGLAASGAENLKTGEYLAIAAGGATHFQAPRS